MTHGGAREGAGRKRKFEPEETTKKNVPSSIRNDPALDAFIHQIVALKNAGLYREGMSPADIIRTYSNMTK